MKIQFTFSFTPAAKAAGKKWCIPDGQHPANSLADLPVTGDSVTLEVTPTQTPLNNPNYRTFKVVARTIFMHRKKFGASSATELCAPNPFERMEVTLYIEEEQ